MRLSLKLIIIFIINLKNWNLYKYFEIYWVLKVLITVKKKKKPFCSFVAPMILFVDCYKYYTLLFYRSSSPFDKIGCCFVVFFNLITQIYFNFNHQVYTTKKYIFNIVILTSVFMKNDVKKLCDIFVNNLNLLTLVF